VLPNDSYVNIDKQVLDSYAVELATAVCDSNTAEQLVYTIQQLMFNEQDQHYRPETIFTRIPNPNNTTFRDLEPWAIQDSNGTVTVDTDKLQTACAYIDKYMLYYRYGKYQWIDILVELYKDYFTKDQQHRVSRLLACCTAGATMIMFYIDSSRLTQLAQLPSIWYFDKHDVLAASYGSIYEIDCAAVIEDNTMVVEVALATLAVRYCERVRQSLIARLLILNWLGTAVLNKGVLPVTSVQMLGHIVIDYKPSRYNSAPALSSKMVPDYEDIPITVHNLYMRDAY
jgi:hypothetical protein